MGQEQKRSEQLHQRRNQNRFGDLVSGYQPAPVPAKVLVDRRFMRQMRELSKKIPWPPINSREYAS